MPALWTVRGVAHAAARHRWALGWLAAMAAAEVLVKVLGR